MNKTTKTTMIIIILIISAAVVFSNNHKIEIEFVQYEQIEHLSIILKIYYDYYIIKLEVQYMN